MATQEHVTRLHLAVESIKSLVNDSSLHPVRIGSSSLAESPLPDLLARLVKQGEFAIMNAPGTPDGAVTAAASRAAQPVSGQAVRFRKCPRRDRA